jgi:hypothetical protein
MGLFSWLRDRARRAVLEGVQLAVEDLTKQPAAVEPVRLELPAGDEKEVKRGQRQ